MAYSFSPGDPSRRHSIPFRHVKRPGPGIEPTLILALAVLAGLMLGLSVFNLMSDSGPLANAKALLISISGALVAYAVNRFAIEKGAPLAAIGFKLAGVLSIVAMLAVGAGMFASTVSGLVLKDVAQLQLQDHGAALTGIVGERNAGSVRSAAVGPAVQIAVADISEYVACEIATSCLSGRGNGGRGTVAIALEALATKATSIAAQFDAGQAAAQKILATANTLIGDYQKVLSRTDIDVWQKQAELLKLHGRIEQQANALAEAIPLSLLRSYAEELARGITIADRPEAAQRINTVLARHAETLSSILSELEAAGGELPAFPGRPGVAETLVHLPHFASLAAIVFVSELMLPLTLWVLSFLKLSWRIEQAEASQVHATPAQMPAPSLTAMPGKADDFDNLIQLPSPTERPDRRPQDQSRRSRRRSRRSPS
jgi:hypothetical protein